LATAFFRALHPRRNITNTLPITFISYRLNLVMLPALPTGLIRLFTVAANAVIMRRFGP
jgi:hypothetical protein